MYEKNRLDVYSYHRDRCRTLVSGRFQFLTQIVTESIHPAALKKHSDSIDQELRNEGTLCWRVEIAIRLRFQFGATESTF